MNTSHSHLQHVKSHCEKQGIKLTALRQAILALICKSPQPLGAYDILRELRKSRTNAEPPTVYRVLEFLQSQHLVHRIDSNNTYISCIQPDIAHHSQLLICKSCGNTVEVEDKTVLRAIKRCADIHGFQLANDLTELRGFCGNCTEK